MANVLQVCPNDHPPFVDICRGYAAALASLGHDVSTVFLENRGFFSDERPFVGQVRFGDPGPDRVDAIIAHRWGAFRASAHLRAGVRVLVAHEFGLLRSWRRRLERRRHPGLVFAGVSSPVAADIGAHGIDDVMVLPNPVDPDEFRAERLDREAARVALDLPGDATVIGVVGRLHPKKDPLRAVAPFLTFHETNARSLLVFLGDGVLRGELDAVTAPHTSIRLLGQVPDARRYFEALDVVLACATKREAFGMVLLEAMAAGVPVVCADQPGPQEVLGSLGFYFDDDASMAVALAQGAALDDVGRLNWASLADARIRKNFSVFSLADRLQTVLR